MSNGVKVGLGYDVNLERLADAVARGYAILLAQPQSASFSGIEIWYGQTRVYGDDCYAEDTSYFTPVVSPFQTAESTMFFTTGFMFNTR